MTKKISVVLAIIMLFTCVFAACGKDSANTGKDSVNPVVGKWQGEDEGVEVVYCFEADGTGYSEVMGFTVDITAYEVKDGEIEMTIDGTSMIEDMFGMTIDELVESGYISESDLGELVYTETFEYSIDGDVLTIDGVECTKVK